jgi:hypothetical protein
VFWLSALDDQALLTLYRKAYASVLPSHYEGYGLPVVEALSQGCVTIASDAGSLPEIAAGHAVFFRRGDGEALYSILERLYGDPDYYAGLKASAKSFRPTGWQEAGSSVAAALSDIASGASHDFGAPLRQMVFLSVHPEKLDLALQAARANLKFIDRIVVLNRIRHPRRDHRGWRRGISRKLSFSPTMLWLVPTFPPTTPRATLGSANASIYATCHRGELPCGG